MPWIITAKVFAVHAAVAGVPPSPVPYDRIMQDLRTAFRTLRARPAFTAVAILTLALGIGANTAVYTVVHGVLLAPLPYVDQEEVVVLNEVSPRFPNPISVSWQNYVDWRERSTTFETTAAFRTTQMTLTGLGDAERVPVRMVTSTLLPMLGVRLPIGRHFAETDDRASAAGVAIVSEPLWRQKFGSAPDAMGRALQLDKQPYVVVGVLPGDFELFQPADVYLPIGPWAATTLPDDRGWHPGILPVARLRDGVTLAEARAEMETISRQLEAEYPRFNRDVRAAVQPLSNVLVQNVRPALLVLLGAVSLVLLIACANVANLLLVRAVARQKEIALRTALGGSRRRIVRQLVIESVVLACLGGSAGVLIASWGVSMLTASVAVLPRVGRIGLDVAVLLFAVALSIATGLVFGLVPALQATRLDLREVLNQETRGSSGGGVRHHRMRSALVVTEIALALVLLVGAALMLRNFAALQDVQPGFNTRNLLIVDLPLSPTVYREDLARTTVVERIVDRIARLPGVQGAAMTTGLPMAGAGATITFNIAGRPPKGPEEYRAAGYRAVTPGYFETLAIQLRKGRTFTDHDRSGAAPVAIINESMARQHFIGVDPVGQRFAIGTEADAESVFFEIVGVVGDVTQSFETGAKSEYYVPYGHHPPSVLAGMYRNVSLVARTPGDVLSLSSSVRASILEIDRDQPLVNVRTMEQAIGNTVAQPRLQTLLLALFALVAVTLAIVGVYGVMAYTVSHRTQEIGVRVALGASQRDVVRMVVGQGLKLTIIGVVIGLTAAVIVTRALEALLFRSGGLDPLTFAAATALLAAAAVFASYVPARRAARVAPIVALSR
jgi:putative ABC transport system permease protein